MENLFNVYKSQFSEHKEFTEYIINYSQELFFGDGVNNIFSNLAINSTDFFNITKS